MTERRSRGAGVMQGKLLVGTGSPNHSTLAAVTSIPTQRAAWFRLVTAARNAEDRARVETERKRIAEHTANVARSGHLGAANATSNAYLERHR